MDKLLKEQGNENTAKIATPVLLVIKMHIGPTRLLEDSAPTAEYDSKRRLLGGIEGVDWGDDREIEEALAAVDEDSDEEETSREKKKRLKKEKMRQKRLSKKARQETEELPRKQ